MVHFDANSFLKFIPEKYLNELIKFLREKKYGSFCFIVQNGEVCGCDILEKKRDG